MRTANASEKLDTLCPPAVRGLLDLFAEAGIGAYPVGGCVRDALMDRVPHDWDIAVTCLPERTAELCADAGLRTVPTGLAHGTVTVLVPGADGVRMPVECTTCRTEGGYSDGRHPDSVAFSDSIRDDLSRRDFTVNAMAAERDGTGHFRILDLFGGLDDLNGRIIRCVGDPELRLREDALRVLRGVRFSVKLGFDPEPFTRAALTRCAPGLSHISGERVREELRGILTSPDPDRGVALLYGLGLAPYVLPCPSAAAEGLAGRGGFARAEEYESRLACLLWGLPEAARRLRSRLGGEALPALTVRAGYAAVPPGLPEAVRRSEAAGEPVTLRELALHGSDLPPLGVPAGCAVGRTLNLLLDAVLLDPSLNTPASLAELVRKQADRIPSENEKPSQKKR